MRRKENRFFIACYNMDTESTKDGYLTAFMANRFHSKLEVKIPKAKTPDKPSRKYLNARFELFKLLDSLPERVRLTQQNEVRDFFRYLQDVCNAARDFYKRMDSKLEKLDCFIIIHFANLSWDLDILKGIIFSDGLECSSIGDDTDLIQFSYGGLCFRDFLRVTGFRSIKMAGMCCTSAHKAEGDTVYQITKEQIPDRYEDYSQEQIYYMENDVLVMDEALNIILNRRENYAIKTLNDLPMTSTSFGRFRLKNNDEIIYEDGEKTNVPALLTVSRWKYARPFLAYLIRAYKGGYCAPNPHIQYKLLENVVCFDAVSMYPDKMLFHSMMQCTKYTEWNECAWTLEECKNHLNVKEAQSAINKVKNIQYFISRFDSDGLFTVRPDDYESGLYAWVGNVVLNIKGVRKENDICMMPFISKYKVENIKKKNQQETGRFARDVEECNGKILSGNNIEIILTSLDLMCVMLCYDCEVVQIRKWLNLSWRNMLNVQKRDLWYAYQRKMHISEVLKRDRYSNDEYWKEEAGFSPEVINSMSDDDYKQFTKNYKLLIKADPNGKYGMTVEKPVHPKTWMETDENGLPVIRGQSVKEAMQELINDPEKAPRTVKASDYCAGSSITMWARWQLIQMMYCFFVNGIETYYCDTDSLFVSRSDKAFECIEKFNSRKKKLFYKTDIGNGQSVNVDTAEGLGQFEIDKECALFKTLGAKNYGYLDNKGNVKITIAGLNTRFFQMKLKEELEKTDFKRVVFNKLYRPNTGILPEACRKLLKIRDNMGYDENGLWRGCTLEPVGFFSIRSNSKFHMNNMKECALLQNKFENYYIGMYNSVMYLTSEGFDYNEREGFKYEEIYTLEENETIKGGVV